MWYLDSGCSRHMTGDKSKFMSLELKAGGKVTLGDNTSCRILGSGTIRLTKLLSIEKVLYVSGLKHNLLSISQLCDKGMCVKFTTDKCILNLGSKLKLEGIRIDRSLLQFFFG